MEEVYVESERKVFGRGNWEGQLLISPQSVESMLKVADGVRECREQVLRGILREVEALVQCAFALWTEEREIRITVGTERFIPATSEDGEE